MSQQFSQLPLGKQFLIGGQRFEKTSAFTAKLNLPGGNSRARTVQPFTEVKLIA